MSQTEKLNAEQDTNNFNNLEAQLHINNNNKIYIPDTNTCQYNKLNEYADKQNNQDSPYQSDDKDSKAKKCLFVELNKDVSYFNLSSFYLVQFSYVAAFTFIDACQDNLLESDIYNIDKTKVGTINGDILLWDTLYLIAFIYIYGAFHDVFGRKLLIVYGFLSMALSLFLYPLAGKVYPNLILVRLIFSNGICAVTTQPLLADYINHKTKGFAGGIAAVFSGFGALFAIFVFINSKDYLSSYKYVYWMVSAYLVIIAIICAFGVKSIHKKTTTKFNFIDRCKAIVQKLKTGIVETSKSVKLTIGVLTSMAARMNTILLTLFLVLWVKSYGHLSEDDARKKSSMIMGIGNVVGLFSAILFGFYFDRKRNSMILFITNSFVVIGYIIFFFCEDPSSWLVILAISISSFGFYGLITVGYVMVNKSCNCEIRGSVMGISCLFGAIGILIIAKIGGLLFDNVSVLSPFIIVGAFSLLLLIPLLFPSIRKELDSEELEE